MSGDYGDLLNTPDIPSIEGLATVEYVRDTLANFLQESDMSAVAMSGDYADLANTPTNVSEFTNDAEYITKAELEALKERIKLGVRADLATGTTYKGAFMSAFSVSDTKRVVFSQGNLQYQPSTSTWRFAAHQYDAVGGHDKDGANGGNVYEGGVKCGNENANNESYTGWIDVFPYGSSGWSESGALYKPTDYSSNNYQDYLQHDLTEDYANADWGVYNAISNGGNKAGMWRTLTAAEWQYVIKERENAENLFSYGSISIADAEDGDDDDRIPGFILLPDDWPGCPAGLSFTAANVTASETQYVYNTDADFTTNVYSELEWAQMQAAGAVFFPSSGMCNVKKSTGVFQLKNIESTDPTNIYTSYWSSTTFRWVTVDLGEVQLQRFPNVVGLCVRLVRDIE